MQYKHIVIFDKYATEEERGWSALLSIGQGLRATGMPFSGGVYKGGQCFTYCNPEYFNPDKGSVPQFKVEGLDGKPGKVHEPDLIFTWGYNYFQIQEYYQERHIDVVKVGRGFLRREINYWYAVKNHELPKGKPPDRYDALRLSKPVGRKPASGYILVCEQDHHQHWYDEALRIIHQSKGPEREVKVRPYKCDIPLEKDLHGAHCVVSYNSTCLYLAMSMGIPVFCDRECLASDVACTNLTRVEQPEALETKDYGSFLNGLAYAQWTLDEYRRGEFIKHLL